MHLTSMLLTLNLPYWPCFSRCDCVHNLTPCVSSGVRVYHPVRTIVGRDQKMYWRKALGLLPADVRRSAVLILGPF